jgi:hypothetical protein
VTAPASGIPMLVRLSFLATLLGVISCFPLLIKETPYTFVVFMFLGQPLLGIGFVLFAINVFRDLKKTQAL